MKVKVSFVVFGNFVGRKVYDVNKIDLDELKKSVYDDIKDHDWDGTITEKDFEITKVTEF
jgi:hypothetical protein